MSINKNDKTKIDGVPEFEPAPVKGIKKPKKPKIIKRPPDAELPVVKPKVK